MSKLIGYGFPDWTRNNLCPSDDTIIILQVMECIAEILVDIKELLNKIDEKRKKGGEKNE
jgi:hypothetical protein